MASLNAAFPPTRAFAREILPGVHETPATIDASFPWIAQTRTLVSPAELGGLARSSPGDADLAKTRRAAEAAAAGRPGSKCVTKVILPTGDVTIRTARSTTGKENYKEFWYALVGLAGEGQNFDGNGIYVRFQPGGGTRRSRLGKGSLRARSSSATTVPPIGNRPVYPGRRPPYGPTCPATRRRSRTSTALPPAGPTRRPRYAAAAR